MRNGVARLLACLLAVAVARPAGADQSGDDLLRDNVLYWLDRADVTAHVRIDRVATSREIRDDRGRVGYIRFRVDATVLESFRGSAPGPIAFFVTQEQPSEPPRGQFIVSLDRGDDGTLYFADDSAWWVAATPALLAAARKAARRQ
jgi:ketosteroid isomerase-like protein